MSDVNSSGSKPSGGHAPRDGGPRGDAMLEGDIEVSVDIAAMQIAVGQHSFSDAGRSAFRANDMRVATKPAAISVAVKISTLASPKPPGAKQLPSPLQVLTTLLALPTSSWPVPIRSSGRSGSLA